MGKNRSQQATLRAARQELGVTSEELAGMLGISLKGLRSWLEPATSASHRTMPETAKILLSMILRERRAKK